MRCVASCVLLSAALLAPATGFYAPAPVVRSSSLRSVDPAVPRRAAVLLPERRAVMAAPASAMAVPARPRLASIVARLATLLVASLVTIFTRVVPALAVSAVRASSSTGIATGDIIKYGGVACLLGAAFAFRREETPILTETPLDDDEQAKQQQQQQQQAAGATEPSAAPTPSFDSVDDSSLNSALFARMQQLASEQEEGSDEADEPSPPPPSDSTDGWGEGNTAVLEPPKPPSSEQGSLFDGEPAVEFPPGFPLVGGEEVEWESEPATASEDQIAMMQRMFGGASEA